MGREETDQVIDLRGTFTPDSDDGDQVGTFASGSYRRSSAAGNEAREPHANPLFVLYSRLKRRHVMRVGAGYMVMAWLVAQVGDVLSDGFGAPDWVMQALLVSLAIGLPIALLISWYVEWTPEGLKLEDDADQLMEISRHRGRIIDFVIITILTISVGVMMMEPEDFSCFAEEQEIGATVASSPRTLAGSSEVGRLRDVGGGGHR
ncbi:MAG: hypothetical protein P8172_02870 [Gammaproteobacteria bacterium]|jgi:hypothetical protein